MKKNKIISILLSLVIAVCLWIYVVSTVTPDDNQWIYNIPVTFVNEDGLFSDRNLTLAGGRDTTVSLRFNGSRQDLLKLNNTNVIITVDLSQGDRDRAPGISLNDFEVTGRLSQAVEFLWSAVKDLW